MCCTDRSVMPTRSATSRSRMPGSSARQTSTCPWFDRNVQSRVITRDWTFLSNHGHVLVCLADEPGIRLRDVAERVGITERSVQHIVRDLEDAGYVVTERVGRRNRSVTTYPASSR